MNGLTVGSLFAGIGGFDLGFERAGMRTVWQVEQNEYRRRVLAQHFPDAERHEDVREVGAHNLGPVGLICGGFPCQDISLAGRGAGIDGERSGLWSEMWRAIRELGPRYVVVENVPALTSRGLDRVLRDLAEGGYDAEWDCLPASAFGAPHRRDRIWLVAYPQRDELRKQPAGLAGRGGAALVGDDGAARLMADPTSDGRGQGWPGRPTGEGANGQDLAAKGMADPHGQPALGPSVARTERNPWTTEPDVGRVAHGIPARVDRLSALGDSLVPQIAEWIGRRIMDHETRAQTNQAA